MRRKRKGTRAPKARVFRYFGIDGEGQGRARHDYVYLGAAELGGDVAYWVESESWRGAWSDELHTFTGCVQQIPSHACLDFLLALPSGPDVRHFSFAFNYDLTKILEGIPDQKLYVLFRPELRRRNEEMAHLGPRPTKWKSPFGDYKLNLQGTKFTVKRGEQTFLLWDIFKFYGSKFVTALKDWKVGSAELWDRMSAMKDKRGEFDKQDPEGVAAYCLEECECMAELAEKLVLAHEAAELPLKAFYGAGSSGGAMLKRMGIKEQIVAPPTMMTDAVTRAFFGGRFENSEIGAVREPVIAKDISSAYPYQIYSLPCLVHGVWRHTTRREDLDAPGVVALVHYGFDYQHPRVAESTRSWGPFPFREATGSICFPAVSGGGWVYAAEYLAGERLWPHVTFREAFVYEKTCVCHPFKEIAQFYLYRLQLGKEGAGIVIKLATNSTYGKLAQSIGAAQFNSWLWAGMITSGTRAQMLEVMALCDDLSDVLMIATDGIALRKPVVSPLPKDTGTGLLLSGEVNPKPLGGWEDKTYSQGLFLARPGIYFPMNPTAADIKEVKGRGVGKGTVLNYHAKIVESWEKYGDSQVVEVADIARFCGAKTSISRSGEPGAFSYTRADGTNGVQAPRYGNWIARRVQMSFAPMPKRAVVNPDGRTLGVRRLSKRLESTPYKRAVVSPEALELRAHEDERLEQPDVDFSEFGEMVGI